MTSDPTPFLARCVSVDLEVNPKTARIFAFAAVRVADAVTLVHKNRPLDGGLDRLEAFCQGVDHLVGHNILRHDLPHLVANRAGLATLGAAPIDTLWLNPLAHPRNPYHHLVKHYQDGRLQAGHVNDPERDARLVIDLLADQIAAFRALGQQTPDAVLAYHHLTTRGEAAGGFDALFQHLRGSPAPHAGAAFAAIRRLLAGQVCQHRLDQTMGRLSDPRLGWPAAYALSWISVAGGASVMPPWVRLQFREAALIVRHLRETNCNDPTCVWCSDQNDPNTALQRWFGFAAFRPEPVDEMGRPLQQRIVTEAMAGRSVLGILPTGTGKSVCYQIPALSRFDKTGALTVVISPLVALMADQVQGLARAGIATAVTVNGMLSLPERHDALEKVRMGDAAILLISPEQLRAPSIRAVLHQREVGLWVLDEAHCVSKWGHDFRPDYRYVSRFIKEVSGDQVAPVLCLTATAKPEVVRDIRDHFQSRLGLDLMLLDGGSIRGNLCFAVQPTQKATKLADILTAIAAHLPPEGLSGAVVYCATRSAAENVTAFLKAQGLAADHFHGGLTSKRTVSTCHALAMRLVGASFAGDTPRDYDGIILQAVALLRGDGLTKPEAEALRDTLIPGFRWLLVDEYQDIGPEEYALIGAVAGRSLDDPDLRISLFAVGDDDQNIYAFAGASIDFIRRFEADYSAKPVWLTENYRSTAHIIAAANAVIAPAAARMKAGHDITANRARAKSPPGGKMAAFDPVAQGRVSLLDSGPGDAVQAVAALDELIRLSRLDPDWSWRNCAVIARDWRVWNRCAPMSMRKACRSIWPAKPCPACGVCAKCRASSARCWPTGPGC